MSHIQVLLDGNVMFDCDNPIEAEGNDSAEGVFTMTVKYEPKPKDGA